MEHTDKDYVDQTLVLTNLVSKLLEGLPFVLAYQHNDGCPVDVLAVVQNTEHATELLAKAIGRISTTKALTSPLTVVPND